MLLSMAAIDMMGQINTVKITAPLGIAGEYQIQRFNWGPVTSTPVSGEARFGVDDTVPFNDGCTDLVNDLTGTIGFIDRGVCGLVDKAERIERAGGIAAIICNTATGNAATAIGGGGLGVRMTISTYMMSNADCVKIRAAILAGGVQMELINKPVDCTPTYEPEVFWGHIEGQGDFSGGLNDWTIENETPDLDTRITWFYTETGFPRSARGFTDNDIKSMTQCNGAACMDLEALQFEDNAAPAQPYNRYTSSLISPSIDCSDKDNINLQFRMFHNRLNGNATYSFFDGTNWTTPVNVPTKNTVNSSAVGETVVIPVPVFAGKSDCRIRFTVSGDFYTFVVDDVMLLEKEIIDVRVNTDWVAVAPTYKVPATQVSEMPFMADISNIGNSTANNTVLNVDISDDAGNVLQTLTYEYGNVEGTTIVENGVFNDTYTPPAVPGFYTGKYYISSDNEPAENDGNNQFEFEFLISENTFGNLLSEADVAQNYLNDIADSWVVADITNYHSAGNVYYVKNGKDFTVKEVRFGLKNDPNNIHESGFVVVDLFEVTDVTSLSPAARTLVATGVAELDLSKIADFRNIPVELFLPNEDGAASETKLGALKDNTTYFVTVNTFPLDPGAERYQFLQYSANGSDVYSRSLFPAPVNYALDALELERLSGTYWHRPGLESSFEDIRGRSYQRVGNEGFGAWSMLYLEMELQRLNSTYDIAKSGTATVFPNPAARELYIDVTLDNVSANVRVDLVTIEGKVATSKSFSNVQDSRLKMDLSGLTSGTYTADRKSVV